VVWNSPLLSTAAALGSLCILYAHHSGAYSRGRHSHFDRK
jgi:hypothetical protein